MAKGVLAERYKGFRYLMEIDGVPRAAFGYCMGLGAARAPVDYFVSDDTVDLLEVADPDPEAHLILAQGIAFDEALEAWQRASSAGEPERHDGAIVEYDGRGRARRTYRFRGARPLFFQAVQVRGAGAERHIDTLELAYDSLTRN